MTLLRAALVALLTTGPAAAQITPEQVWTAWQGLGQGAGYQITATGQRRDGASLLLDGVEIAGLAPTASFRAPLGQVVMRDLGNGSVEVTMPPAFDMAVSVTAPGRDAVELSVSVEQEGYVAIVSGTPQAPRHAVSANALTIGVSGPAAGGAGPAVDVVVSLGGIRGTTALVPGAPMGVDYDLAIDAVELSVATDSPAGEGRVELMVTAQAVTTQFQGTVPGGIFPGMTPADAMAAGLRGTGRYDAGAIEFGLDLAGPAGATTVAGAAAGGSVDFGLDEAGLTYRTGLLGLEVSASGAMVPVPSLDLAIAEYSFGLTLPLARTQAPADFAVLFRLAGLVVSDATWAMIDPTGALPRDPASVVLEAKGKATPAQTPDGLALVGQVDSVAIDALEVSLAGAALAGADRRSSRRRMRPDGAAVFMQRCRARYADIAAHARRADRSTRLRRGRAAGKAGRTAPKAWTSGRGRCRGCGC
jgi:hypothetical protein